MGNNLWIELHWYQIYKSNKWSYFFHIPSSNIILYIKKNFLPKMLTFINWIPCKFLMSFCLIRRSGQRKFTLSIYIQFITSTSSLKIKDLNKLSFAFKYFSFILLLFFNIFFESKKLFLKCTYVPLCCLWPGNIGRLLKSIERNTSMWTIVFGGENNG